MDQNDQAGYEAALNKYQETSSISGIFSSFGDAPGGLKEEFREITWGLEAKYSPAGRPIPMWKSREAVHRISLQRQRRHLPRPLH